jgi:aspartokinase
LNHRGIPGKLADTVITDSNLRRCKPLDAVSKKNIIQIFNENKEAILVITGFIVRMIARNHNFSRNGSNYTASLVANYINAEELQNFTSCRWNLYC